MIKENKELKDKYNKVFKIKKEGDDLNVNDENENNYSNKSENKTNTEK